MADDGYCTTRSAAVGGDLWLIALFASRAHRPALQALGALRADLLHLVAHRSEPAIIAARAGWWQQELSQLGRQPGQHPTTRLLAPLAADQPALRDALLEWTLHLNEELGGTSVLDEVRWRLHLVRAGRIHRAIALLTGVGDAPAEQLGPTLAAIDHLATLGERVAESRPAREIGPAPDLASPSPAACEFVAARARVLVVTLDASRQTIACAPALAIAAALAARRAARLARDPASAWRAEPDRSFGALFTAWWAGVSAR